MAFYHAGNIAADKMCQYYDERYYTDYYNGFYDIIFFHFYHSFPLFI